jgi:hypothetical protein
MRDAEVYARGVDGTYEEYVGFDPDNVSDVKSLSPKNTTYRIKMMKYIKPMGYFAKKGDLPMMRWLYVNGADTRDEDVAFWFPMYAAAAMARMEACKWLFAHGAAKDFKRRTRGDASNYPNGRSPLHAAFGRSRDLSRWLVLNGALCKDDDSGKLDVEAMQRDLGDHFLLIQKIELLLEWATDLHRARTSFLLFLSGALSPPMHACSTRRNVSSLQLLGGKPGILELIGDYVGIVRGREARIIRQLTKLMPGLIQQDCGKQGAMEKLPEEIVESGNREDRCRSHGTAAVAV